MRVEVGPHLFLCEHFFSHVLAGNAPHGVEIDKERFVLFVCFDQSLSETAFEEADSLVGILCLCHQGDKEQ